ncbi:hypothetical protein BgiMline_002673, partial [Biomphalaria glabrata]
TMKFILVFSTLAVIGTAGNCSPPSFKNENITQLQTRGQAAHTCKMFLALTLILTGLKLVLLCLMFRYIYDLADC